MQELDYYARAGRYYEKRALVVKRTITWELKITHTDRISFRCLAAHQEEKLLKSERSFSWKIDDTGRRKKPYDGSTVYNALPVVTIIFYKTRAEKVVEMTIREFIHERETCEGSSMTFERAAEIGRIIKL